MTARRLIAALALVVLGVAGAVWLAYRSADPCVWTLEEMLAQGGRASGNPIGFRQAEAGRISATLVNMGPGRCLAAWADLKVNGFERMATR